MYIPAKIFSKLARILQNGGIYFVLYFFSSSLLGQQADFKVKFPGKEKEEIAFQTEKIIDSLQQIGFLVATYKISADDSLPTHFFSKGERFVWGNLKFYLENSSTALFPEIFSTDGYADKIELKRLLNKYLKNEAHNNGYPFAEAQLRIDSISGNEVHASVYIQLKNQIVYDSISIVSEKTILKASYLQNYLGLPVGKVFSTENYLLIPEKLKHLKFLRLTSPPTVEFSNSKSQITMFLEPVASNQLDAFIGFVPEESRTNLTGQVDISFRNLFKRAINWEFNWQKYSANSQYLNTRLLQNAAFNSKLGYDLSFSLLQEDSTFLQNAYSAGILYPLKQDVALRIGYKGISNNIIREIDSSEARNTEEPFRSSNINSLDFLLSWRQKPTYPILGNGYYLKLNFDIGIKKIKNFSELPDSWESVPEQSNNYQGVLEVGAQQKVFKRFSIEEELRLGVVQNDALARNDLLRLGGLQNLRGFDRNFFFTKHYALLNMNYRYFLDNNSSFFLLSDIAQLQKNLGVVYALGAGIDVKSKNGWFRLIYALGSNTKEKINFSTAKVHFGYIALF